MHIRELESCINTYLEVDKFKDPSLNGLQVEGFSDVTSIATAASASLEAIDAAVEQGADTLIVHHGLLWQGQDTRIVGTFKDRLNAILEANLNLLAYHLPLDAHLTLGNNRYLSDLLGLEDLDYVVPGNPLSIAMQGMLEEPLKVSEIAELLSDELDTRVSVLGNCDSQLLLNKIAVCSGSGSFLLDKNPSPNFEALVTGDVNEQTYHLAIESGTPVFVVGHHASEQGGIKRLGVFLSRKLGLEHQHLHFSLEKEVAVYDSKRNG